MNDHLCIYELLHKFQVSWSRIIQDVSSENLSVVMLDLLAQDLLRQVICYLLHQSSHHKTLYLFESLLLLITWVEDVLRRRVQYSKGNDQSLKNVLEIRHG